MVTAFWISWIFFTGDIRATPPSRRMSEGTRSRAITDAAPASSATFACSAFVTSMMTPPFSISASPMCLRSAILSPSSSAMSRLLVSGCGHPHPDTRRRDMAELDGLRIADRKHIGLAEMLKGGVIMDVTNAEQAKVAEDAGAASVMALERVPSDIRRDGGVARMSPVKKIQEIQKAVTIPVMAKARIGHFVEAQILEALAVDYIDESEVLTPADE